MLEKFLNKKVEVIATTHGSVLGIGRAAFIARGIVTGFDSDFMELDNKTLIHIKYIVSMQII